MTEVNEAIDLEVPRTEFLAAVSGLEFAQVMLCNHYNGGYGTPGFDDSLLRSLPADWYPRLMAAWDEWDKFLETVIDLKSIQQIAHARRVVRASGRPCSEAEFAALAGLSVDHLLATEHP